MPTHEVQFWADIARALESLAVSQERMAMVTELEALQRQNLVEPHRLERFRELQRLLWPHSDD